MVLVLAACASSTSGEASDPQALMDHTYTSTSVTEGGVERPLVEGSTIELSFSADGISAAAGCNRMFGPATWENGTITMTGELAATRMACPPELMAQDDWLAGILTSSPTWALEGTTLTLMSGTTVISLRQASG